MNNIIKLIFGWGLLVAGIILIGWVLISSYNIFTGQAPIPELFEIAENTSLSQSESVQDIQGQFEQIIGEQLKGIIPADSLPKMLNLAVWSMMAFLLVFGGAQIAGIGIKLLKS